MREKNDDVRRVFGRRLAEMLRRRGYTHRRFAELLDGRDKSTIDHWCQGLQLPEAILLPRIAELLDCDLDYLYGRTDEEARERVLAAKYTGLSEEAVELVRDLPGDVRGALQTMIDGAAPRESFLPERILPELPAGDPESARDFLQAVAEALAGRSKVADSADRLRSDLRAVEETGADLEREAAVHECRRLELLVESQTASRANAARELWNLLNRVSPPARIPEELQTAAAAIARPATQADFDRFAAGSEEIRRR